MEKSMDFYLSKGFSPEYAAYFAGGRRKIVSVCANDDFSITLSFDNGEVRCLDMRPTLSPGTVFEPFCQLENFKRVYLDEDAVVSWDVDPTVDSRVHWNNKVDISPDYCYVNSVPEKSTSSNP